MGGIVKRSLAMARPHKGRTIAKAFGLDDATHHLGHLPLQHLGAMLTLA
jgi:hypothetical protein